MSTFEGVCAGGCGAGITYRWVYPGAGYAPELELANLDAIAFGGGHLCGKCGDAVRGALAGRRRK